MSASRLTHDPAASGNARVGVVACGALALHVREIARRRGWAVDVHPLPPGLHNRPERIAPRVAQLLDRLAGRYDRLAIAYADCGSFGALQQLASERGVEMLAGEHCYDVFGAAEVRQAAAEEPGTYFLTDFLACSFERTVWRSLGLDRYPELRDDYFGRYRRVIWLAQRRSAELDVAARRAAAMLELPLEVREVGERGLERQLGGLIGEDRGVRAG